MKVVTYKNHSYTLLWIGQTKFGKRAHLQFRDGSKDFWVDGNLVSESASTSSSREMCAECGQYPGFIECSDSSGIVALCCRQCARQSRYDRSFA
jgi:hypothetical protein